jgi:hypothetical protein
MQNYTSLYTTHLEARLVVSSTRKDGQVSQAL